MKLRFVLLGPLVLPALWAACADPRSHIYVAEPYDKDANCLYPGIAFDIEPGAPTDSGPTCDAICITDPEGGVWLSGQCPPLPTEYILDPSAPGCAEAFAASRECRQCNLEGGGVSIVCDAGKSLEAGDAAADVRDGGNEASEKDAGRKDAAHAK